MFVSFCVVVWVLFSVFSIFCITSLVSATPRNHQFFHVLRNCKNCICLLHTFPLTNLSDVPYCTSKKDNLFAAHRLARGWGHYNTGPSTPQNIQTGTLLVDFIPNLKLYHEKVMPRSVLLHSLILKSFQSRKGPLFNCIERYFVH